jgi:hypothetical protein
MKTTRRQPKPRTDPNRLAQTEEMAALERDIFSVKYAIGGALFSGEQVEHACFQAARIAGIDDESIVEMAIGELLDAGLVCSTMIKTEAGHWFPGLRWIEPKAA